MMNKLGICFYPTTTLLIDDNEDFLTRIQRLLTPKNLPCQLYSDPQQALNFINTEYHADPFTNRCISSDPDRDGDTFTAHFDYRKIHHEIYNPHRFQQVSTICIDYAMPNINGLDFCRQIQDEFSLKLLLTGEAGPSFAIDAFNEDYIDKYLQKGSLDLPDLLLKDVQQLQQKYFLNLSDIVLNKHSTEIYKQTPNCLADQVFIDFFHHLCIKHHIAEYYLLDEHGSFLLLDRYAHPSWLIVKSDQAMQDLHKYADLQDAPQDVLDAFANRMMVPYFHTDEDWQTPFDKCHRYLHPSTKLTGKEVYHYAYIENPNIYHLNRHDIVSYDHYIKSVPV